MTPNRSDATLNGPDAADQPWRLRLGTVGSFSLDGPAEAEARFETPGWSIHGSRFEPGTRLDPSESGHGWLLFDVEGTDLGSIASLTGGTIAEDPPSVTLSNGRVYRIARSGAGYRVCGWESSGAYLEVAPDEAGWRIDVTAAGTGMDWLERLVLLTAAVIVRDDPR